LKVRAIIKHLRFITLLMGIIDLDKYYVARYSNGSVTYTGGGITHLEGFLPAHSAFILVNG
jgi:hypothetical protein